MATNFPNSLDSLTNPLSTDQLNSPSHSEQHINANDAIEALEAKVGTDNSAVATSLDYRVRQLELNPVTSTANKIEQVVVNNTGSTLLKGQVVYASGSVGASGKLRVSLSSNSAESTSSKTFGILAENIIDGGEGILVSEGLLEGIDTTGANDGDPVWLGSTPGSVIYGLVNKPYAPNHLVFLGIVVRGSQQNTGSIFVKIQNGFELDELHTVSISSLADQDLLTYDSTTGLWKNKTFATLDIATQTYVDEAVNSLSNTVTSDYVPIADVGQPDGVASLDSTGLIPLEQLGNLIDGAPTALDTLNELAVALGDDANFATTVTTSLSDKASLTSANTFTTSPQQINTASAATIGLIVKASPSQSVAMQQWQDSGGTIQSEIRNSGQFRNQAGAILGNRNGATIGLLTLYNNNAAVVPLVVQATASQTANLQEWQNNAGTVLARIQSDGAFVSDYITSGLYLTSLGKLRAGSASSYGGQLEVTTTAAENIGAVIRGAASQTADLQQWQNSAGTVLTKVRSSGQLNVGGALAATTLGVANIDGSWTALKILGAASQTANLQEWQNNAGTILARISSGGAIVTSAVGVFGSQSAINNSQLTVVNGNSSYPAITVKAAASQTANLQEWQNSSGYVDTSINSTGRLSVRTTLADAALNVGAPSASTVAAIIRGAASQTANLQEWQNSSGTILAKVSSAGQITSNIQSSSAISTPLVLQNSATGVGTGTALTMNYGNNDYATIESAYLTTPGAGGAYLALKTKHSTTSSLSTKLLIDNRGTVTVNGFVAEAQGLIIKGAASQTANLTEWQDSSGTVLASLSASGNLMVQDLTVNGTTTTINSTTLTVDDKNIELASVTSPTDTTADGAGITIKGATDKTFNWVQSTAAFTSSEPISAPAFKSAGTAVSSNITLSSGYRYFVDTTAARTLTLPASSVLGDEIQVFDASNLAGTNNVTINSNGGKINGSVQDAILDVNGAAASFVYTGSTYGWRIG